MIIQDIKIPVILSDKVDFTLRVTRRSGGPFRVVDSPTPGYLRLEYEADEADGVLTVDERSVVAGSTRRPERYAFGVTDFVAADDARLESVVKSALSGKKLTKD